MIRSLKPVLLVLLALLLASCASTTTMTTSMPGGQATAPLATNVPVAPQAPRPASIVTATMRDLHISGEAWASEGNPHAPITVVEFSDYGCPFCGRYVSATSPLLKKQYIDTGKIFYVYKDFPVVQLHPQAEFAAEAAECAGDQHRYWPMHDLLFANQHSWDTTQAAASSAFAAYAQQLGLDIAAFRSCLISHAHTDEIQQDMAQGRYLGTTGTPTFIINGKQLVGVQPTEAFVNAINNELNHTP